jgi:hypothetical protein
MESCKLDLHGVRHQDVDMLVENFIYTNQDKFPLTIVCGNSNKMITIVEKVLNRIGCDHTMYRFGIITVGRFK